MNGKKVTNLKIGNKMFRNLEAMTPMEVHAIGQAIMKEAMHIQSLGQRVTTPAAAGQIQNMFSNLERQKRILDNFLRVKGSIAANAIAKELVNNQKGQKDEPAT